MVATTTFTSTSEGSTSTQTSTRDCDNCSPSCDCWTVIYQYGTTFVAICDCNVSRIAYGKTTYDMPAKEFIEEDLFPDPIDRETLKLWRELSRKRPRYRSKYIFKPYIKRRVLNSKSGWLARVGRKKKRGK